MELLYKNNLFTNFIKQLLATCPIPIYKTVRIGDVVVEGTRYVNKNHVFEVLPGGTGTFYYDSRFLFTGPLVPREDLVGIDHIFVVKPGDTSHHRMCPMDDNNVSSASSWSYYRSASTVNTVGSYTWGESKTNLTRAFTSNVSYYDADTHKHLGDYLRCLRDIENLDLMSLYNCYAGEQSDTYHIEDTAIQKNTLPQSTKKLLYVPVKFNTDYTIGIDSPLGIKVLPVLLSEGKPVTELNESLKPEQVNLKNTAKRFNYCSYENPVLFRTECLHPEHQSYEKYLYLAIEVSVSNTRPLVVLEGDHTLQCSSVVSVPVFANSQTPVTLTSRPSLLQVSSNDQHVVADSLFSYLLDYTIDTREQITANIKRVEDALDYRNPAFSSPSVGVWTPQFQYYLYRRYNDIQAKYGLPDADVLGYIDKNMDTAIRKGWLRNS